MLNRVMFIGHLGKDPEMRYTAGGDPVCNFSVASTEKWKGADGEPKEKTEWLRCTVWGKLAEICNEYLEKGKLVYIGGKLQTRKWQDKDGKDQYTTECVVSEMRMLGGGSGEREERPSSSAPAPARRPAQERSGTGFDAMDDDIPFISNLCDVSDTMGASRSFMRLKHEKGVQVMPLGEVIF